MSGPPADTKPMAAVEEQPTEVEEDTLSGLDSPPVVDTMVVPSEQVREMAKPEQPKERFGVQAARVLIALAVIAALLLLVYWLLGQSQ